MYLVFIQHFQTWLLHYNRVPTQRRRYSPSSKRRKEKGRKKRRKEQTKERTNEQRHGYLYKKKNTEPKGLGLFDATATKVQQTEICIPNRNLHSYFLWKLRSPGLSLHLENNHLANKNRVPTCCQSCPKHNDINPFMGAKPR